MSKVRLALVGCGERGIAVAELFHRHPDCEITACCDRFRLCAERAAATLAIPEKGIHTDYQKLLREAPADALFLAPDPNDQVEMACEALRAGKHVCTEVPAAFTLEDCRKLIESVEKTGCKYQLMEQVRHWGFVDAWKQSVERGELGHVCLAQGEYIHYESPWGCWTDVETGEILQANEKPAGRKVEAHWRYRLLADPIYYLPHTMSPLLKILDDRVVRVSCMGTRRESYAHPGLPWTDLQYALMHTEKDTVLLAGAGFSLPHVSRGMTGHHWYELRGTGGILRSPIHAEDSFQHWRPGMTTFEPQDLSTLPLDATEHEARSGHGGVDARPVDTFIRSILDDTAPPLDVYRAAELTAPAILAAESARQGGAVLEVPDFRPKASLF